MKYVTAEPIAKTIGMTPRSLIRSLERRDVPLLRLPRGKGPSYVFVEREYAQSISAPLETLPGIRGFFMEKAKKIHGAA
jgi:hypothetical protein